MGLAGLTLVSFIASINLEQVANLLCTQETLIFPGGDNFVLYKAPNKP